MDDVEIKGWRNGVLVLLPGGDWETVLLRIEARLDEGKGRAFWRGAQATLDFGPRSVAYDEMSRLIDRLKSDFGLIPVAAISSDAATRAAAERNILKAYEELPVIAKPSARDAEREAEMPAASVAGPSSNALYLHQTFRSGQKIIHEGNLVISGDVNAGAEVFATGDIVVLGTLRGLAHAGYAGDETATIAALTLRPQQLRIAGRIARSPEETGRAGGTRAPEIARISDGEIQVFPL